MNPLPPIFDTVFYGLLFVIPILLAIGGVKMLFAARVKGAVGERAVSSALRDIGAETLNDVLITDGRGGLTQLDHVVLTPGGLLVIETKNYKGKIFGEEWDNHWTQELGRRSYEFENPIHQNYLHIEALKALLPGTIVQGLVVFAGGAEFPNGMPNGVSSVLNLKKDIEYLPPDSGIDTRLWDAWDQLKSEARTDRSARREHLASIPSKHGTSMAVPTGAGLLIASIIGILAAWLFYSWDKPAIETTKAANSERAYRVYEALSNMPSRDAKPAPPETDSNQWRCNYWREQYRTDNREQVRAAMEDNCSPVLLKWED